jgi:hypothetical protein
VYPARTRGTRRKITMEEQLIEMRAVIE